MRITINIIIYIIDSYNTTDDNDIKEYLDSRIVFCNRKYYGIN